MAYSTDREGRKIEILEAAKKLFGQFGLKKTSLDEIARSIGLSKTSLYHYFKNKEDLFSAVIRHETNIIIKKLEETISKHDLPDEKIKAYFLFKMYFINKYVNIIRITKSAVNDICPYIERERSLFVEGEKKILFSILEEGIKNDVFNISDPEFVAVSILASIKGLEESLLLDSKRKMNEEDINSMLNMFFHGILQK